MVLEKKTPIIVLLFILCLLFSCNKGKNSLSTIQVDTAVLPAAHAEEVVSLISDSGITRYRMHAAVWDIYSSDTLSYWYFPKGIYLEQFDSIFTVEGSIKADTAYYFQEKDLWRLVGNVEIQNLESSRFYTDELFWNKREPPFSKNAIFTDKFVRIEKDGKVITSIGLRTNQYMTAYSLYGNSVENVLYDSLPPND